jgi:hypothetical protein
MTPDNFILWLRGFASAVDDDYPTLTQWGIIKEQLAIISLIDDKVENKPNTGGYTISIKDGTYGTTTTAKGRADTTYKQDELTTNTIF